ncbi:MAG: PadR family transcriptional regulator [Candidatus Izimaplasma sp.]|nr:PadR family transcriptional regulator [Candidatus Izimaplasma bacterium]
MSVVGDLLRGHTESIILALLIDKDSYGYEMNKQIEKTTEGKLILTEATLYTVFKRLEKKDYIRSYWQNGQNNVRRKYYFITDKGKDYLTELKEAWIELEDTMNSFLKK